MRDYFKKVFRIIGDQKKHLPWMLVLYFVAMALELVGISLIIPFIAVIQNPERLHQYEIWTRFAETFSITTDFQALLYLSSLIFTVYFMKTIMNIQTQRTIIRFSYNLQIDLRDRFSKLYLSAPYLFHTRRRSNEIINILQSHISQFSKAVIGSLLKIAGESITLTAISIFLLMSYPVPTITALVLLILFGIVYDITVKQRLKTAGKELIAANNDLIKSVRQGILSLKETRVLGCTAHFQKEIADSARRASNVNAQVAFMQMLPRYILELLMVGVVIAASLSMVLIGDNGPDVIDSLAVFAVAALRLLPASNQIISNISNLRYSHKSIEELYADMDELESTEIDQDISPSTTPGTFKSLRLQNICFTYPDAAKPVLDDINLNIKKGEIIGIVGPSGAGKSTLIDIILGLIQPQSGQIFLNESEVGAHEWAGHQLAAYIPQKPAMLDEAVTNNIALGQHEDNILHSAVKKALDQAQMTDVIANLPDQERTTLGEDAVFLSGGQKQRIALARTFYFSREIIIFDEATSALDKSMEQEVLKAIKSLRQDAALLIVTHSEQPLEICDRIYHISDGKIVKETKN